MTKALFGMSYYVGIVRDDGSQEGQYLDEEAARSLLGDLKRWLEPIEVASDGRHEAVAESTADGLRRLGKKIEEAHSALSRDLTAARKNGVETVIAIGEQISALERRLAALETPPRDEPAGPPREETKETKEVAIEPETSPAPLPARAAKENAWTADEIAKARELRAGGMEWNDVGRAIGRSGNATKFKLATVDKPPRARTDRVRTPAAPEPEPVVAPANRIEAANGKPWTDDETKTLIRVMSAGTGIAAAMKATGHSYLACDRRWQHLKQAGVMTVERFAASQEATVSP